MLLAEFRTFNSDLTRDGTGPLRPRLVIVPHARACAAMFARLGRHRLECELLVRSLPLTRAGRFYLNEEAPKRKLWLGTRLIVRGSR